MYIKKLKWVSVFAVVVCFASSAHAMPAESACSQTAVDGLIENASLIIIGAPESGDAVQHLSVQGKDRTYQDIAVEQVLKGSYAKPSLRIWDVSWGGASAGFVPVETRRIILLWNHGNDGEYHVYPDCPAFLRLEGNQIRLDNRLLTVSGFEKEYANKRIEISPVQQSKNVIPYTETKRKYNIMPKFLITDIITASPPILVLAFFVWYGAYYVRKVRRLVKSGKRAKAHITRIDNPTAFLSTSIKRGIEYEFTDDCGNVIQSTHFFRVEARKVFIRIKQ